MPTELVTPPAEPARSRPATRWFLIAAVGVVAWFLLIEVGTEAWYRWRESQTETTTPWNLSFPAANEAGARGFYGYKEQELGETEQEILRFDKAQSASWRDDRGNAWTAFYLQWEPDKRLNQTDLSHNPTSCLPAAGLKLVSAEPDVTVDVDGRPITFRSWIFSMEGRPVYVFTATRRERELQRFALAGDHSRKFLTKLSKPWFGNRSNPLETLQLVGVGPKSMEAATGALKDVISNLAANDQQLTGVR